MVIGRSPQRALLSALAPNAHILVLRLRSLGDTLLTTPALRALKAWRPDLQLSVLVEKAYSDLLAGNPDVTARIELDSRSLRAAGSVALLKRVRRAPWALCVDVHGGLLGALLAWTSGARYRVGRTHFRFRFAYNVFCPEPPQVLGRTQMHTVEDRLSTFYWLGLPLADIPPLQIFPQASGRAAVREKLAVRGVRAPSRYAVLHPTATFSTKQWPPERFAAVAQWLEEEHGIIPVFSCGPGETQTLAAVAETRRKPLVRLDSLSVAELVALIEGACLFIGNDSGPAHIAAALRRPLVVLFGSSNALVWRPWRAAHERVQNYFPCNPCPGDRCYEFAEPKCILSITIEQVEQAVARALTTLPPVSTS